MNESDQLTLDRPQPLYRQLFQHYASAISSGQLQPGDRIPPTQELARRFAVAVSTVQEALDQLRRQGLVDRVPGRGTVVSQAARARTWGVVFGEPVLLRPDRRIYPLVADHLQRRLAGRGIDLRVYHPRHDGDLGGAWQDIHRDAAAGLLRVLLPLCPGGDLGTRLREDCPVAVSTGAPWRCDGCAFGRLGAARLLANGRRRIALLAPDASQAEGMLAGVAEAHAATGAGLPADTLAGHANTEAAGHALALARLAAPGPRPDAWLVGDDNAARGVLTALLWHRCAIPADAAVICHGNRGLEPVFPIPVTRLEFDPEAMAEAVITAADAACAGLPLPTTRLVPTLVPGATDGAP